MAHCQTHLFAWAASEVFDAALTASSDLGFAVAQADRAGGHVYLDVPRLLAQYPRRFDLSVTDSGLGDTAVIVSWGSEHTLPWPVASEGRSATRLCRRIHQTLDALQVPTRL